VSVKEFHLSIILLQNVGVIADDTVLDYNKLKRISRIIQIVLSAYCTSISIFQVCFKIFQF